MKMQAEALVPFLSELFLGGTWPKPLHLLRGVALVEEGRDIREAAGEIRSTTRSLQRVIDSRDRLESVLGLSWVRRDTEVEKRVAPLLGQLLLGRCAESAFEAIYRYEMSIHDLSLLDLRESRTDTDYRLINGQGRPVYRLNIKFHGARFIRARELVSLDPADCFALATYKIHGALRKQEEEGLPYLFAIVGDPDLSGQSVGGRLPKKTISALAYLHQAPKATGKRDIEDLAITRIAEQNLQVYQDTYHRIYAADWYVLSARRADKLLREKLFERVYALRIRGFAQQFRRAELDMHFSLSQDLTPLRSFLATLRDHGSAKVVTLIERGDF